MAARAAGDSLINFKILIKLFGSAIILYELGTLVSLLLMIYIPVESLIIYSLGVAVANVEARRRRRRKKITLAALHPN